MHGDDKVIEIRDVTVAHDLKRPTAPYTAEAAEEPCESCGKPVDEVLITTGGTPGEPFGEAELWRDAPIAVDGWACVDCGIFRYPRNVSSEHVTQLMTTGVAHGRAGRIDDAEQCFLRVIWDWPGYPPGHLNYAEATRSRLHATGALLDEATRQKLVQRMVEHYEIGVAEAATANPAITRALITLVEYSIQIRAFDRARHHLAAIGALPDLDDETRTVASELTSYLDQRLDLLHSAAETVMPFIDVSDRKPRPLEPADRTALAGAITDLEEHMRHAPDRWQSAWLHAKALLAAERTADGLAAFQRASLRFPDCTDIARDYSNHLLHADDATAAREVNRAILAHHPDDPTMLCNLAVTELLCGDPEAANRALVRSLQAEPNDPIARTVEARIARGAPFPSTLRELEAGG